MIRAPKHIPYFYNRASHDQKKRLDQTFKRFDVQQHHTLLGESILRLGKYIDECSLFPLPSDKPGKALFSMYKYYDSLKAA